MQVACNSCGAVYEFDAAVIPAEGYDAQCTTCSSIFFVKPESDETAEAAPEEPAASAVVPPAEPPSEPAAWPVVPPPEPPAEPAASTVVPPPEPPAEPAASTVVPPPEPPAEPPAESAVSTVVPPPEPPASTVVPPPEPPAPDGLITVTCKTCSAAYQFSPADIPAEGYDAQCTQCQSIFFVSPTGDALAPDEPSEVQTPEAAVVDLPEPITPGDTPAVEEPAPIEPPVADAVAPAQEEDIVQPVADGALAGAAALAPEGEVNDLLALDNDLGEPDEAPVGVSMEDDFEAIVARKRRFRMIALATLGGVVALLVGVYFGLPGIWDSTIGPVVGIKARIHPEAIPYGEAGFERLLADTDEAYADAIKQLDAALAVDSLYPDAVAFAALAHTFRGKDIQERGREMRTRAEVLIAELGELQKAKKKPKDADARMAVLRAEANKLSDAATKLYQQGGDELRAAEKHVSKGIKAFRESPTMITAAGIYVSTDPDRSAEAEKFLKASLKLHGVQTLDLQAPPDAWTAMLRGMIDAGSRLDQDKADAAFRAAMGKQPRLLRARYELARLLMGQKKSDEAKKVVQDLLEAAPDHPKGKQMLAELQAADAVAAAPSPAPKPKSKGSKGKKKKKRR